MDAVRRANFASKQIRAGPAPLASFEDLPSDELESPEEFAEIPIRTSSALDDETSSLQFATPDSLTVSSQSTPRIECDFDSNFTVTPGDSCDGQSTSELRTTSMSSLSTLSVKQKKGSNVSLGTPETSDSADYNQRKSSWTNIFRSHSQNNSAKSSVSVSPSIDPYPDKSVKKKSKKDTPDSNLKQKEKGKFLSLFKKKSNKNLTSPLSPSGLTVSPNENLNEPESEGEQSISEEVFTPTLPVVNGKLPKGKENESPDKKEACPSVIEGVLNDLGKGNLPMIDKIPDERKINRKLINISTDDSPEKEYNILSKQVEEKQVDLASKSENIQAIVEHESSDSELVLEDKETVPDKKDEIEAENLIALDEMDEDSMIEVHPRTIELSKQTLIPSRQQRLEVTTKPIDRPRSTTPINVAPLEAFIQSVSPTFVSKVEKIKLSLPGEQFVGRVKSPKKSSVKSWTDFCERGLHSPRLIQRTDSDDHDDPFGDGANFPSEPDQGPNWAAFEPSFSSKGFSDDFGRETNPDNLLISDPYQSFETNFSCSCVCHAKTCDDSNKSSFQTESGEKCCECNSKCQPNALCDVSESTVLKESLKCDGAFDLQNRQVL